MYNQCPAIQLVSGWYSPTYLKFSLPLFTSVEGIILILTPTKLEFNVIIPGCTLHTVEVVANTGNSNPCPDASTVGHISDWLPLEKENPTAMATDSLWELGGTSMAKTRAPYCGA